MTNKKDDTTIPATVDPDGWGFNTQANAEVAQKNRKNRSRGGTQSLVEQGNAASAQGRDNTTEQAIELGEDDLHFGGGSLDAG